MPKHEPEVLAAVRRRKPIDNPLVPDDDGGERQQLHERRPYSAYWLLRTLIAWGRSLLRSRG
jgi:hypothetical protein